MSNLDRSIALPSGAGVTTDEPRSATEIFITWMQHHGGILVKVARAFEGNIEDQRDLRQQMQVQIWRSLENFSGQAKASTWIYRVCLNTALSWQRSEKRRRIFFATIRPDDLFPNEDREPEDPRLAILYGAIQRLAPIDRALILLQLEERSYREIGEITGLTESNVGVRLQRSRKKLAEQFQKEATE